MVEGGSLRSGDAETNCNPGLAVIASRDVVIVLREVCERVEGEACDEVGEIVVVAETFRVVWDVDMNEERTEERGELEFEIVEDADELV